MSERAIPTHTLSNVWRYRSFRDRAEHVEDINELLFGEAELEIAVTADGDIDGYLRFGALGRLKIDGKADVEGRTTVLRFQGVGKDVGLGTSGWVCDYVGWLIPDWEDGVNQKPALVGSVIRSADHGTAKAGVVASFIAVQGLEVGAQEPPFDVRMPDEIIEWMKNEKWSDHHTRWHIERNWDLLTPEELAAAVKAGWARYSIQEGQEGNGLDFLAMHRVMIRALQKAFPSHAALFQGWDSPPTDPFQTGEELPGKKRTPFNPLYNTSITRVTRERQLSQFIGDDDLGRYLETPLSPTPKEPTRRNEDFTAGIHNFLHNRWSLEDSPIDLGKPEVNIFNQRFWRLHGWIDKRWDHFRLLTGRKEDDAVYREALKKAESHLQAKHVQEGLAPAAAQTPEVPEILHRAARRLLLK